MFNLGCLLYLLFRCCGVFVRALWIKMSSLWTSRSCESGILRKNDVKDNLDDLLVFGYACKLFRDDDKAREIDQGKHLIPWMGDNSLKIDRYDGRGALSDLTPYQSSKEGFDAMRWLGLSESERKIEQLCDEERYFALNTNEDEDELYKEEELKRSQNQSKQFGFNYDETPKTEGPTLPPPEEEDEPFHAPPELDIPVNMQLPSTVKQNARIEKTALFISKEGPQMEILLKTKQAGNPQFAFLTQDDQLYRYYRHVLMAIKTGRYKVETENSKIEQEQKNQEHYLHPSLAPIVPVTSGESQVPPSLPLINYKPSADCAYSKLVNRIQGTQPVVAAPKETTTPTPVDPTTSNGDSSIYSHPAYIQHYQQYGYYPQYDPTHPFYAQYEQYKLQYAAYQAQQQKTEPSTNNNPYAQIVSNVKSKLDETTPTAVAPEITKAPILYTDDQKTDPPPKQPPQITPPVPKPQSKPPLFSLAQYSDSESDSDDNEPSDSGAQAVVIPSADIQLIIDKMASYVAKNGIDFEAIVRSKGDQRFVFLEPAHMYHPYYKYKLKEFGGEKTGETSKKEEKEEEKQTEEESKKVEVVKKEEKIEKKVVTNKIKEKKIITPVCFSIKKPRDSDSVSRDKSALPVEDSTDDEEQGKEESTDPPSTTTTTINQTTDEIKIASPVMVAPVVIVTKEETEINTVEKTGDNSTNIIEIEDPIMELIDLTDDLEERRDTRRAEDRLKDKLAAAAREKLAAKNRALQMERKKRAAAFLSQLKPTSSSSSQSASKNHTDEIKTIRSATPEDGEIYSESGAQTEDLSRLVYQTESKSPTVSDKEPRSRSNSRHRHKESRSKKNRKRSRSRRRDYRSHDHKKSKRRHRSKSRSRSRHRKSDKKETSHNSDDKKMKKEKAPEPTLHSSDYESDK